MAAQAYSVPIILPDLRKEESYLQIVDALEYLDAVANDVFNRISCRVAENRDQLVQINNRILTSQAKIDKLRSASTKAARVFSSPKYPAPAATTDYRTIYQDVNPMLHKVRKNRIQIESRLPEVNREVLLAKSKPLASIPRTNRRRGQNQFRGGGNPETGEGLGSLPRYLPSVSSLLLFNTAENPYKKYVLLDPLQGAKTKTRDKVEEESELSDAPITITQGEELGRAAQDSMMYVPLMPELSQLDVPEMLPQLQYVASDVFYSADVGASIAPSLAANVPDLPNLADPDAPAAVTVASGDAGVAAASAEEPQLPPPSAPAPPPPPPPPTVAAPPLPSVGGGESSDEDEEEGEGGAPEAGDGRANLMAAIRKAGGASKAGLKKGKKSKRKAKAKKEEESSPTDLLGDLSAALGRRRKAMSGRDKAKEASSREDRKEEHNLGGGSMMDNISKMIPAPPGGNLTDSGGEGEEEEGAW